MRHRWTAVAVGLIVTVLAASAVALGTDRLLRPGSATLDLPGVTPALLASSGLSLSPAVPPPYCALVSVAHDHGLPRSDWAGCPLDQNAATGVAGRSPATVQGAALARVGASANPSVAAGELVWAVVYQRRGPLPAGPAGLTPVKAGAIACPIRVPRVAGPLPACRPPLPGGGTWRTLYLLDAHTGSVRLLVLLSGGIPPTPVAGSGTAAPGLGIVARPVSATPAA
ncbi:MAG: hypothetical protein M3024_02935 [Candidatus Dormibacteraeota bacterium]|nr:hypothetical protein [Candidatus Dormibacteraeota bacterium]